MKLESGVVVQTGILATDSVQASDQQSKAVRSLDIPVSDLVLLVVDVFFGARTRDVLHQLERRAVDPVVAAQRRGQEQPGNEGAPTAVLQVLGQDIRSVRPEVGPE